MFQNYIVSYVEADEETYGFQVFEDEKNALAYFNKMVDEECEQVYLAQILKIN